jgi:hypothetical protein
MESFEAVFSFLTSLMAFILMLSSFYRKYKLPARQEQPESEKNKTYKTPWSSGDIHLTPGTANVEVQTSAPTLTVTQNKQRDVVRVAVSFIVLAAAFYVILSAKYPAYMVNGAYALSGLVVGYWLKSASSKN